MARFGFSFDPPAAAGAAPSYDDTNMSRRYGITDHDLAAKFGYGLGDEASGPPSTPRMSDAEIAVFSGHVALKPGAAVALTAANGMPIPKDGCQGESLSKVGGRLDTSLPSHLNVESLNRSQADRAVQEALHQWSTCMAQKGFTVDLPFNAANLAPRTGSAQGPSSAEITVALDDIDCKAKTNLVTTWFKAESGIQQQLVESNQLALSEERQKITDAVKAAAAVVGR
ncbi:hypothetical protein E6W39_19710 [Kitasatospora acidiphila]|uniref:Uncharacterized protein n=1 Tax=Kitasatospora acidiphila TaxID=2567942 RepID=A0A540W4X5_9ACTN|nr:hypothetical protein [Kitasatospora acidiphila]TQF04050.1 hypothetical protein E6W39_19710 [Kitasatospora acidiphila]